MTAGSAPTLSVGEFVALLNQTIEYAYPSVTITGELAHFAVRKNRWVYFDLKDDTASVRFFGTVYQLPGPLEDGMLLAVRGTPRLHPQFGFSVNVQSIRPLGEGTIKKAADLLKAKLTQEGLFDPHRKRPLPYPPAHIGLVTSGESAAYHDFVKVLGQRWGGMRISHIDVQVQGEAASGQIVAAIEQCNQLADPPEVLVVTRGGGSAEDLQAFSTEQLTRAVASSRIPTLVAIGHEVDTSLAELAADQRASTPSNAAELLVPSRQAELTSVQSRRERLTHAVERSVSEVRARFMRQQRELHASILQTIRHEHAALQNRTLLLGAFNPTQALRRGYAMVRKDGHLLRSARGLHPGDSISVALSDATLDAQIKQITITKEGNSQ